MAARHGVAAVLLTGLCLTACSATPTRNGATPSATAGTPGTALILGPLRDNHDPRADAFARQACAEFTIATRTRSTSEADTTNLHLARATGYALLAAQADPTWRPMQQAIDDYLAKATMFLGATGVLATGPDQIRAVTAGPSGADRVRSACRSANPSRSRPPTRRPH